MRQATLRFFQDDSGATAIEYTLIASLISVAIVIAATLVGLKIQNLYQTIAAIYP